MDGNYKSRIMSIVDKIVDGENKFNTKNIKKQADDKSEMATEIGKAISILNDVGQGLVLDELDTMANKNSLEFFDNNGNISLRELMNVTSSVVKSTIEKAQKEGIDLTRNGINSQRESAENENVLTYVVISKMINNYENLSYDDRKMINDNWHMLSVDQRSYLLESIASELRRRASEEPESENKRMMEEEANLVEYHKEETTRIDSITEEEASEELADLLAISKDPELKKRCKEMEQQGMTKKQILSAIESQKSQDAANLSTDILYLKISTKDANIRMEAQKEEKNLQVFFRENRGSKFGFSREDLRILNEDKRELLLAADTFLETPNALEYFQLTPDQARNMSFEELAKLKRQYDQHSFTKDKATVRELIDENILKKIQTLPTALSNANFPEQHIKKSILQYADVFRNLGDEDIEELKTMNAIDFHETLKDILIEDGMDEEIAQILSSMTFDGKIQQILTDEEARKKFVQELEETVTRKQDVAHVNGLEESAVERYVANNAVNMTVAEVITLQERSQENMEAEQNNRKNQVIGVQRVKQIVADNGSREGLDECLEILNYLGRDNQVTDIMRTVDASENEESRSDD